MKLHSQQISAQKLDLVIDTVDEEDLKFTNMITQGNYWTSDEDEDDQDYSKLLYTCLSLVIYMYSSRTRSIQN
jgi:hypothetical protein